MEVWKGGDLAFYLSYSWILQVLKINTKIKHALIKKNRINTTGGSDIQTKLAPSTHATASSGWGG